MEQRLLGFGSTVDAQEPPPPPDSGSSTPPPPPPPPDGGSSTPPPPPPPPDGGFSTPPPPPDGGSSTPPPPSDGGPQEPEWIDPVFENVTITSILWGGAKHWDRALAKLSNGRSAFVSKGSSAGQTPFDYEELRLQGGGYYDAPAGTVGHVHTRNGGSLIIKDGQTFKQQQYAWGNQGPVFAANTQDVTSQIGVIENMADADLNNDGFIGEPEKLEEEAVVESVVYNNLEGEMDRSIYKMKGGEVWLAEQGLDVNDVPMEGDVLSGKDGNPIETANLAGLYGIRDGFAIVYANNGVLQQQSFSWGNRGPRAKGSLRNVTKQKYKIEERLLKDVDGDGKVGEDGFEDLEVSQVLVKGSRDGFDRSLCRLTNGAFVLCERKADVGLPALDADPLKASDGKPFNATDVVGLLGLRRGFAAIMKQGDSFTMQKFKWGSRSPKAYGKTYDITRKIDEYEIEADQDFNGDQVIGEADVEVDTTIARLIRDGSDLFDQSLYETSNGHLIFAESGLVKDDTPFEDEIVNDKNGQPYNAANVKGIYPIKRGFALIEQIDGVYKEQGFRVKGDRGPKPFGRLRKVRNIIKTEEKANLDLDGNNVIGDGKSNSEPGFRAIHPIDLAAFTDSLA